MESERFFFVAHLVPGSFAYTKTIKHRVFREDFAMGFCLTPWKMTFLIGEGDVFWPATMGFITKLLSW